MKRMKKWYGGLIFASIFMILVLRYATTQNPFGQTLGGSIPFNTTNPFEWVSVNPLEWVRSTAPAVFQTAPQNTKVIPVDTLVSSLYTKRNLTTDERDSLLTWNRLTNLINNSLALPNAIEASKEASYAWNSLMAVIEDEKLHVDGNSSGRTKEKQCPHYLNRMNTLEVNDSQFRLLVPCGLTQGSSITIIGTPNGLLGDFQINLTGEQIPGETEPPIILHYNVRLHGDKVTEDPVIVQNTWTAAHDWGDEDRCPSPEPDKNKKVDELDQCNVIVGKDVNLTSKAVTHENGSKKSGPLHDVAKTKRYFPFKQGYPFVATLRVGSEGIQMTVDGKHITSFAYRETLEPWLIGEVRISGDVQLISILASGLPTSEVLEHVHDLEALKAVPIQYEKPLDLFVGIFSTANNFMRRMAVRRTWMQYPQVRSGSVAVRFFVGLHKNQRVNEELWNEARTYGDVQLMPFVDYYSLITWKTVAICIFGSHIVSANYVMKTDDDAFVRVDEVITSLNRISVSQGLLYGLINSVSQPHRDPDSKWYITTEEWPEDNYPPWAHGPGYVISHDIANAVAKRYLDGNLKMFKLEDVAMGIWIADMKKDGIKVRYENEERVYNSGCQDNYVVAHYQSPREMLCLWQKLQETKRAFCCGDRKR